MIKPKGVEGVQKKRTGDDILENVGTVAEFHDHPSN